MGFFVPETMETIYFVEGDPDLENDLGPLLGVTPDRNDVYGSLIFVESIRDYAAYTAQVPLPPPIVCPPQATFLRLASAHELAHQFGVEHNFTPDAAGLMRNFPCCPCWLSGMGNYFSGRDLDRIRRR